MSLPATASDPLRMSAVPDLTHAGDVTPKRTLRAHLAPFAISLAPILLLALLLRVGFGLLVMSQQTLQTFPPLHGDTSGYIQIGERMYRGETYTRGGALFRTRGLVRPPGYPAFYVGVRKAYELIGVDLNADLRPIIWPQVVISLVQVAMTYQLAWLTLRRRYAAVAAGLIAALSPTGIAATGIAMADSPFAAMFSVAFVGFVLATRGRPAIWITIVAGLALVAAALLKPAAIYWPLVAMPALIVTRGWNRGMWADALRLLLPLVLVVALWTTYNYRTHGVAVYSIVSARNLRYDVAAKVEVAAKLGHMPNQAEYFQYALTLTKRDNDYLREKNALPAVTYRQITAETRAVFMAHPVLTARVLASNFRSQVTARYKVIHRQLSDGKDVISYWIRRGVDETDNLPALWLWFTPLLLALPLWFSDRRVRAMLILCWLGWLYVALPTSSVANEGSRLLLASEPMGVTLVVAGVCGFVRAINRLRHRTRRTSSLVKG